MIQGSIFSFFVAKICNLIQLKNHDVKLCWDLYKSFYNRQIQTGTAGNGIFKPVKFFKHLIDFIFRKPEIVTFNYKHQAVFFKECAYDFPNNALHSQKIPKMD